MQKKIVLIFLFLFSASYYSQNKNYPTKKLLTTSDGLPSNFVYDILKDNDDNIWLATDKGVSKYNGSSYKTFTIEDGLPTNDIFGLNLDSKNRIWIESYGKGLYYIKNDSIKLIKNSNKTNGYKFYEERNDKVIFYKNYGLFVFFLVNNELVYNNNREKINIVSKKRYDSNPKLIKKIKFKNQFWEINKANNLYRSKNSFINKKRVNIFSDIGVCHSADKIGDLIFILNKDYKLFSLNLKTNKINFIKNYKKNSHKTLLKSDRKLLIPNYYNTEILKYYHNKVTIETINNHDTINTRYSSVLNNELYSIRFNEVYKTPNEKILYKLKKVDWRLNHINAIAEDKIIVSNENGIHKINILEKSNISNLNIKNTISTNYLNNNIFVSTTEGLKVLNDNLKLVFELPVKTKVTSATYDEDLNKYYIISDKGILVLNNNLKIQKIINEFDGLPKNSIVKLIPLKEDVLAIHTSGYSLIDKQIFNEKLKASIDILSFKVGNFKYNFNEKIKLKKSKRNIIVNNSIKTFNNPINFIKYYSISSNNENLNWIKFNEKELKISNLSPGNYKLSFGLKKINSDKIVKQKTIIFSIAPYFWETYYFLLVIILFTILITFLSLKFYKRKEEKKYLIENKLNSLEIKALKAQMNPHFIFNSLNNIQSSFLLEDEIQSNKFFINFSKLLRTTLEMVNVEKVALEKEIKYIDSYIKVIKSNHNVNINSEFIIEPSINLYEIHIPPLIIQPFVENAILHGLLNSKKDKKIIIRIFPINKDKDYQLEIEDNGVGRNYKKESTHKSLSTSLIINRINLLNKISKTQKLILEIVDLKNKGKALGTKIILKIIKKI